MNKGRPAESDNQVREGETQYAVGAALSGKVARALEGRNPGFKPPYGYNTDPDSGAFIVDSAEAEVVRRIFALHRQGAGVISIARRLNDEGVAFRFGRRWSQSTVRKILCNPIYRGELQYGRTSRNPDHAREKGEPFYHHHEPMVVLEGVLPAIIPPEEWAATQIIRGSRPAVGRGASGRAASSRYLLSGIACCRCGNSIVGHKAKGDGYLYYCCSGQRARGKRSCNCGYLRQEAIDRMVLARFREEFLPRLQPLLGRIEVGREAAYQRVMEARGTLAATRAQGEQAGAPKAELEEAEMQLARWEYEVDMVAQAREVEGLPVEQQKQVLRYFVRSVRLFRHEEGGQLICDLQWKDELADLETPDEANPTAMG